MARVKFNFQKTLVKAGGLGGGAVVIRLTDKFLTKLNPNIRNIGQLALGILGPPLINAKPNSTIEQVGDGMASVAAYKLLGRIKGLSGIGDFDEMDESIGERGFVLDDEFDEENLTGLDDEDQSIGNLEDEIDELDDLEED